MFMVFSVDTRHCSNVFVQFVGRAEVALLPGREFGLCEDWNEPAVHVQFEDLPLRLVRVPSSRPHRRHASAYQSQRLAGGNKVAFFGFLDNLSPAARRLRCAMDSPAQREASALERW
jgi:hypothetical protein